MTTSLGKIISAASRTPLSVAISSLAGTIFFGLFDYDVSRAVVETAFSSELKAGLQATIVGIGAGLATWFVLTAVAERRQHVRDELERLAELNHTIRNSLSIIVLAHHNEVNQQHRDMILDCTQRIDATLKQLFPVPMGGLDEKP